MEKGAATDEARDQFVRETTAAMATGSDAAWREFFENYFDQLYRHLLVLTRGNENLTRELAQHALLRVVRYIKPFENERVLWAWLRQLARSCHIDWLRREKKNLGDLSLELLGDALPQETAEESDEELFGALESGLSELDPSDRELIHSIYTDRLPHKKAAQLWNTSPKAIESRLARARQKLRKLILEKLNSYALL